MTRRIVLACVCVVFSAIALNFVVGSESVNGRIAPPPTYVETAEQACLELRTYPGVLACKIEPNSPDSTNGGQPRPLALVAWESVETMDAIAANEPHAMRAVGMVSWALCQEDPNSQITLGFISTNWLVSKDCAGKVLFQGQMR